MNCTSDTGVFLAGVILAMVAGSLCGTWAAPTKRMRRYGFEHWLLIVAVFALIVFPWATTCALCPDVVAVLREIPRGIILKANLFFVAWGMANVLFGYCLARIGFSLTFGIMTGIGLPLGMIVPMVLKASGKFADAPDAGSLAGIVLIGGSAIMLFSVCLTTIAGMRRERERTGRSGDSPAGGILMAVMIGVLQIGMCFAFVYSQGTIANAFLEHGAPSTGAIVGVWALSAPGGAIVNIAFAAMAISWNKSWRTLSENPQEFGLGLLAAIMFFASFSIMGLGMNLLGALGASVGFGITMAFQILASQVLGFAAGEWTHASGSARRTMCVSVALMLAAVVVISSAKGIR